MNLIAVNKHGFVYELRNATRQGLAWSADYRLLRVDSGERPTYTDWVPAIGLFPDTDYSFVQVPA